MFLFSRTLSSLAFLPAIGFTFVKGLYVDCLVIISSMVGSIIFHYVQENEEVVEVFDLDFWNWLCIDTLFASLAVVTIATYITKIRGEARTLVLLFTVLTELVLDMHFSETLNNGWLYMENIVVSAACILLIIFRRRYIRSTRIQFGCIVVLCGISVALNNFVHSLFHVGLFGSTFLLYYFEETAMQVDESQNANELNNAEESIDEENNLKDETARSSSTLPTCVEEEQTPP